MLNLIANRKLQFVLLLALLAAAVYARMADYTAVKRIQNLTFDTYNRVMPREAGDHVTIVDIDEESLQKLGQWPWPRTVLGDIVTKLRDAGAAVVVFDIVFAEPDRTSPARFAERFAGDPELSGLHEKLSELPDNDALFGQALEEAGNVVSGISSSANGSERDPVVIPRFFQTGVNADAARFVRVYPSLSANVPEVQQAVAGNGNFALTPEDDFIIRRVPFISGRMTRDGVEIHPSLALEALRVLQDETVVEIESYGELTADGFGITGVRVGKYTVPTESNGEFWVHYAGHRPEIYVPAWRVAQDDFDAETVKDKIVLIGTSAAGLWDLRASPLSATLPGVEVHAEVIDQVLNGQFLVRPDFLEVVLIAMFCLFVMIVAPYVGILMLTFFLILAVGGTTAYSVYAYRETGQLIDPLYPSLTFAVFFMLSAILSNLRAELEKRAIRDAFGMYVSGDLMEELTRDPDKLKLGGEVRELSVMFTDVRKFTTISEALTPEELIELMNAFLTPMTSEVMQTRGTIDKYMGDAMMAFWNAPLDDPDHARHACAAALAMADALAPVNEKLKEKAEKENRRFFEVNTGIGIATGPCSVGNMGSRQRFAYSALGDAVNLASRLEGQTKAYGVPIMIAEETYKAAPGFAALELDLLRVVGRAQPARVYALVGDESFTDDAEFLSLKQLHDAMLQFYRARKFDQAGEMAEKCRTMLDGKYADFYAMYMRRCEDFVENPPPSDWDGVWVAEGK